MTNFAKDYSNKYKEKSSCEPCEKDSFGECEQGHENHCEGCGSCYDCEHCGGCFECEAYKYWGD